jgi:hypothetical protein
MRTLATGLEAYYVDNNRFPATFPALTTPIAYIATLPQDPFSKEPAWYQYVPKENDWLLFSVGPDQTDNEGALEFDSTNGTLSTGDIIRRHQ